MAQSSYSGGSDQFSSPKQRTTDQFGRAAEQTEEMAPRLAEQGRQTAERIEEAAVNFKDVLHRSMRDEPMATLAFAAIVGFVLGALWKS
jgi:ElaB/YqjD/DUF883 family membrane-anchored ribosome-binding protein